MGKYFGKIGYAVTEETSPGVWTEAIIEREYFGDLLRLYRTNNSGDKVNPNIILHHEISIVADPYAFEHFAFIRYITYGGAKWSADNVEVQYPRLVITTGGVYNA